MVANYDISDFTTSATPRRASNHLGATLPKERVAVYVDGFNLIYGMRSKGWRRYYWLDLKKMVENLLRSNQTLQTIRYFTANLFDDSGDVGKASRQATYLEAIQTLSCLSIHLGYFQPQEVVCRKCGNIWRTYEEKMTDVNISVALINDAHDNLFDTAMIISADSDLVGPIRPGPLSRQTSDRSLPTRPKIETPPPSRKRIIHHRSKQTPRQPTPRPSNQIRRLPAETPYFLDLDRSVSTTPSHDPPTPLSFPQKQERKGGRMVRFPPLAGEMSEGQRGHSLRYP